MCQACMGIFRLLFKIALTAICIIYITNVNLSLDQSQRGLTHFSLFIPHSIKLFSDSGYLVVFETVRKYISKINSA